MRTRNAKHGKIVKAAIKFEGKVYTGWRHNSIINDLIESGVDRKKLVGLDANWDQGFITEDETFLSRKQALSYGKYIGQIDKIKGPRLTSEDLWDADGTPR